MNGEHLLLQVPGILDGFLPASASGNAHAVIAQHWLSLKHPELGNTPIASQNKAWSVGSDNQCQNQQTKTTVCLVQGIEAESQALIPNDSDLILFDTALMPFDQNLNQFKLHWSQN